VAVIARGSLDVWEARGEYQLVIAGLEPQGEGALQAAFERLKQKLEAEGLFAADRKRPLPRYPRRVGIVTSPTGAVIRDMLHIFARRWPGLHIRLYPALVQGEGAAAAICEGVEHFSGGDWADVVIVGRGGGSLEDLWAFNEEPVARAVATCRVPVVSAVGHETDFTICDFAADLRAPTPSAAAELVAPNQADVLAGMAAAEARAVRAMRYRLERAARRVEQLGLQRAALAVRRRIATAQQTLDDFSERLRTHDPRLRLARLGERLAAATRRAGELMRLRLERSHRRLEPLAARLGALSPLRVLERGYAIVQNEAGKAVKRPADAPAGSRVRVRLAEGGLKATVDEAG
jgi:exodeoxyribonuclease VII large subunit